MSDAHLAALLDNLPAALDTPRARIRLALLDRDYAERLIDIRRRMEAQDLSPADLSGLIAADRDLDGPTDSDRAYLRSVLTAATVSRPTLKSVDDALVRAKADEEAKALGALEGAAEGAIV